MNLTNNAIVVPVHPILLPSFEDDLFKLFSSHKDLMARIKKCGLVLPDDDYIDPHLRVYIFYLFNLLLESHSRKRYVL